MLNRPTRPGVLIALLDQVVGLFLQGLQAVLPRSSTIILKPPALPRPSTGGAPNTAIWASCDLAGRTAAASCVGDGVGIQLRARAGRGIP